MLSPATPSVAAAADWSGFIAGKSSTWRGEGEEGVPRFQRV